MPAIVMGDAKSKEMVKHFMSLQEFEHRMHNRVDKKKTVRQIWVQSYDVRNYETKTMTHDQYCVNTHKRKCPARSAQMLHLSACEGVRQIYVAKRPHAALHK